MQMSIRLVRINTPRGLRVVNVSGGQDLVISGDSPIKLKGKTIKPRGKPVIYCTLHYYTVSGFTGKATVLATPVRDPNDSTRFTKEWVAIFKPADVPGLKNVPATANDQTSVEAELWIEDRGSLPPLALAHDAKAIRLNVS